MKQEMLNQKLVLTDSAIENQHSKTDTDSLLPNKIKLMNTGESMKRRKVKAVIRFHTPNKRKEPELFFHHLLMLYYPWQDEGTLRGEKDTYASKFYEADVQAIVECNRAMFEPDAEAVIEALEWLRNNHESNIVSFDCINDQENEDIELDTEQGLSVEDSFSKQSPADFGLDCKSINSNKNGI